MADGVLCMWDMIVVAGSVHIASCMRLRRLQARTLNLASDIKSGMECVCVCMYVCMCVSLSLGSKCGLCRYVCMCVTYMYVHIYKHMLYVCTHICTCMGVRLMCGKDYVCHHQMRVVVLNTYCACTHAYLPDLQND